MCGLLLVLYFICILYFSIIIIIIYFVLNFEEELVCRTIQIRVFNSVNKMENGRICWLFFHVSPICIIDSRRVCCTRPRMHQGVNETIPWAYFELASLATSKQMHDRLTCWRCHPSISSNGKQKRKIFLIKIYIMCAKPYIWPQLFKNNVMHEQVEIVWV